jgi:hypothetical protein
MNNYKKDSHIYDSLMLSSNSNLVKADSFLLLSLNNQYNETRKKYQNTNAVDSMLIKVHNVSLYATEKQKNDKKNWMNLKKVLKIQTETLPITKKTSLV